MTRRGASQALAPVIFLVVVVSSFSFGGRAHAQGFTSFSPPITGATDFITGFPTCPAGTDPISGLPLTLGPIGLLFDGTNFFATDPCTGGTTYRFTAAGGNASSPSLSSLNALSHSLALVGGVYYGADSLGFLFPPSFPGHSIGVYSFDPNTLSTTLVTGSFPALAPSPPFPANTRDAILQIIGDPQTGNLLVTSYAGLFAIQNPSGTPTVTNIFPVSSSNPVFDGAALSQDGSKFFAATGPFVIGVDRAGNPLPGFPVNTGLNTDGIAVTPGYLLAGGTNVSNNVLVNTWQGELLRIDTNNANALSVVASGGSRGDFETVGPDGCLYVTQSDRIEKMSPCFFAPFFTGQSNTAAGTDVTVVSGSGTVNFANVTSAGNSSVTQITNTSALPPPPPGFTASAFVDVSTTATFSGPVTVCFDYMPPGAADLFHFDNNANSWVNVTTSNTPQLPSPNGNEGNVCGQVNSLSPFLIALAPNICLLYDSTRSVKGGAVYPIKLELCDSNGADLSSSSVVLHATGVTMTSTFSGQVEDAGNANPDMDFRFDPTLGTSGGYIFNLSTQGYPSGALLLHFTATGDAADHTAPFGVK